VKPIWDDNYNIDFSQPAYIGWQLCSVLNQPARNAKYCDLQLKIRKRTRRVIILFLNKEQTKGAILIPMDIP
jgi:hypothetical protein